MVQYLLAIAIAAFSIVAVIMGGPSPESLLLLAFTAVGVIALFPGVVHQNRAMLIGVFQALSTGLIIFGWFMVLDAGGEAMEAADLALAVTFVTVGAFGLLAISIPASMLQDLAPRPSASAAPPEHSYSPPQQQEEKVNPHLLFSQIDSVLREGDSTGLNLSKPTVTVNDDDPTTHFSADELQQIRSYAGKVQTKGQDEDPTTLFSKNEIDEIRQYADRIYGDKARKL